MRLGLGLPSYFEAESDVAESLDTVRNLLDAQLRGLDARLGYLIEWVPIDGSVDDAGSFLIKHDLDDIPDTIIIVPDAAVNWYVTAADKLNWGDTYVRISFSAACNFTGFVGLYDSGNADTQDRIQEKKPYRTRKTPNLYNKY